MRNKGSWIKPVVVMVVIILTILALVSIVGSISNKQAFDMTFSFERAIVYLPNGDIIDGKVTSWKDFEDGDQIQVKIDGKTYLTHATNVALISN